MNADSTAYTFELRDDVTFQDGTPFDAEAVKANFSRIADPATASTQAASMLGGNLYAGTDVTGPHTAVVRSPSPTRRSSRRRAPRSWVSTRRKSSVSVQMS